MHAVADRTPILFLAASGLAREAAAARRAAGGAILGCLDDNETLWGTDVAPGLPVLGGIDEVARYPFAKIVVCAGRGFIRQRIVERLLQRGVTVERYATIIHPSAILAEDTDLGAGSVILASVVATANVMLQEHVVCMPSVVLTHDDRAEPYATLCAGVVLGGNVTIGAAAYIGMGASVREGRTVGSAAVVGMGASVVTNVPAGETWAGVPARKLG